MSNPAPRVIPKPRVHRHRLTRPLFAMLFLLAWIPVIGATPKLGLVATDDRLREIADQLTVVLSSRDEVELLERDRIGAVLKEQRLNLGSGGDLVRLGALLSANGLLVLERRESGDGPKLAAKLVAAGPGVVLLDDVAPWPDKNAAEWCERLGRILEPLLPKLAVAKGEAIPVSVLNLRSALQSREARETERELTLLLIHRLAREPRVFVLERRHLATALFEKEIAAEPEPFWTGRYLVDGTLDGDGFDPATLHVRLRLALPDGTGAKTIEVSGPRTNRIEMAETLTRRILAELDVVSDLPSWRAADEARGFKEEARWALRWALWKEAQAASDSAWVLGERSRECTELRLRSRLGQVETGPEPDFSSRAKPPHPDAMFAMLGAMTIYRDYGAFQPTNGAAHDLPWFDLGLEIVGRATALLLQFHDVSEARVGHEPALEELRSVVSDVADLVRAHGPAHRGIRGVALSPEDRWVGGTGMGDLVWRGAGLWDKRPEETVARLQHWISAGYSPADRPPVRGWKWEDRKRVPGLFRDWIDSMAGSPDPKTRLEAKFLATAWAPFDGTGTFQQREEELVEELWEQRRDILTKRPGILWRTENVLRSKRNLGVGAYRFEPWKSFQQRLRLEYLRTIRTFDDSHSSMDGVVLKSLFSAPTNAEEPNWSAADADELLPLLKEFRAARGPRFDHAWIVDRAIANLETISTPRPSTPSVEPVQPVRPQLAAESRLSADFIAWNVAVQRGDSRLLRSPAEHPIVRGTELWVQITSRLDPFDPRRTETLFARIHPTNGTTTVVAFPSELGQPDPMFVLGSGPHFETDSSGIWVSVQDHLAKYSFSERNWSRVSAPLERGAVLRSLGGQLYLSNPQGLLRSSTEDASFQVLASTRRRPAVTPLDTAGGGWQPVMDWGTDRIALWGGGRLFVLDAAGAVQSETVLRSEGWGLRETTPWPTDEFLLFSVSGFGHRDRLLGIRRGTTNLLNLLSHSWKEHAKEAETRLDAVLRKPTWSWPTNFALRGSVPTTDGDSVLLLHPTPGPIRSVTSYGSFDTVPGDADGRSATLLAFYPGCEAPVVVPLVLKRKGHPVDLFRQRDSAASSTYLLPWVLSTDDAMLIVNPDLLGHWRIPKAAIRSLAPSRPDTSEATRLEANP